MFRLRWRIWQVAFLVALILSFLLAASQMIAQNQELKQDHFYYGVFEDAGFRGTISAFTELLTDLDARGFNAVLFTNSTPPLAVADETDIAIIAAPMTRLCSEWFCDDDVPATIDKGRQIIGPIVDMLREHPGVIGYNLIDDAVPAQNAKIKIAMQVFRERDPSHPAMPMLVPGAFGNAVYSETKPPIFLTYSYPSRYPAQPCDFYNGLQQDWVARLRSTTQQQDRMVPLWIVLQTHGDPDRDGSEIYNSLREPSPAEVRLQHWLALGEDAKAVFWFVYSSLTNEGWRGLVDNPALFNEITTLRHRLEPLIPALRNSRKITDRFHSTTPQTYVSTLYNAQTETYFVIVANHACTNRSVQITSAYFRGTLVDLETGNEYSLPITLPLDAGDGRMFAMKDLVPLESYPEPQVNLIRNPSFELDDNADGVPDFWSDSGQLVDNSVSRTGHVSMRVMGEAAYMFQQVNLKPDTLYYLSHWLKVQDMHSSAAGVRITDGKVIYASTTWAYSGEHDWEKRMMFFRTPATGTTHRTDLVWSGMDAGAVAWVDDLVLCEAEVSCEDSYLLEHSPQLPEPGTTPEPTPTPTISALIENGNFELTDTDGRLDGWTLSDKGVKQKCNKINRPDGKPDKIFAYTGLCALMLKGQPDTFAWAKQKLDTAHLQAGTTVTLHIAVRGHQSRRAVVKLILKHVDDSIAKQKSVVEPDTGSYDYKIVSLPPGSVYGPINKAKLMLKYTGDSGKLYLDSISFEISGVDPTVRPQPLPTGMRH